MTQVTTAPSFVTVDLGDRSYSVLVGWGTRRRLSEMLPAGVRRVALVTEEGHPWLDSTLAGLDRPAAVHAIPGGEANKNLATIEALCSSFVDAGVSRADCVVSLGGGLVTDVAGFTAATFHRGLPVVHVATTLLAQVDAAIGGKTGVNLPEGKNLVGAYWQPSAVICDTETLTTLPEREWRCGMGEVAKYHWLGGHNLDELSLEERVARCVAIKAEVVASDEREGGRRAILNYGHTLAHAIETVGDHELAHGEAVAVGLVFAAELAHRLGRIDADGVAEHRRVVGDYGLVDRLEAGLSDADLLAAMARDKKARDGLTFVLDGPDGVDEVTGVPTELIVEALAAVR
ncbi:MAG: 3-dehydroquinate synthase family protein [Microthrixaceae bacterium]